MFVGHTNIVLILSSLVISFFRLCLVPGKFEGKCEGKKIQRKSRRKEKVKENKKIDKNLINYFFCYFKLILFILTHQYKD